MKKNIRKRNVFVKSISVQLQLISNGRKIKCFLTFSVRLFLMFKILLSFLLELNIIEKPAVQLHDKPYDFETPEELLRM